MLRFETNIWNPHGDNRSILFLYFILLLVQFFLMLLFLAIFQYWRCIAYGEFISTDFWSFFFRKEIFARSHKKNTVINITFDYLLAFASLHINIYHFSLTYFKSNLLISFNLLIRCKIPTYSIFMNLFFVNHSLQYFLLVQAENYISKKYREMLKIFVFATSCC